MSNKVKLQQIALAAGVSEATVDRVLNERGGVSDEKRSRVIVVAKRLGFERSLPSPIRGALRFDYLRPGPDTAYYRRMDQALQRYAKLSGARVLLNRTVWSAERRQAMLDFIQRPRYRRHGLIVLGDDTEDMRLALRAVADAGVPVIVLCNDVLGIPQSHYVGINHYAAGRTAAYLIGQLARREGRVLLLTGSMRYHGHRQRAQGFLDGFATPPAGLRLEGPLEIDDNPELAQRLTAQALSGEGPVVGIYSTCFGSPGIQAALRGMDAADRPAWVAHETTDEHASLVKSGWISFVIDQDADAQAAASLQQLLYVNGEAVDAPISLEPKFHLMTAENWFPRLR